MIHNNILRKSDTEYVETPKVSWAMLFTCLMIYYGRNIITIRYAFPQTSQASCLTLDVTDSYVKDPAEVTIRNRNRHNHVAGSYNPKTNHIIIWLKNRRFAIPVPPNAVSISCGGGKITLK